MATKPIHDALFKSHFGKLRYARDLIEAVLPPSLLEQVDLTKLSRQPVELVHYNLRSQRADLLFRAPFRRGRSRYLYCLIEHKSSQSADAPLQMLSYTVEILRQLHLERAGPKYGDQLYPVLITHAQEGRWEHSLEIDEVLFSTENPETKFAFKVAHRDLYNDEFVERLHPVSQHVTHFMTNARPPRSHCIIKTFAEILLKLYNQDQPEDATDTANGLLSYIRYTLSESELDEVLKMLDDPFAGVIPEPGSYYANKLVRAREEGERRGKRIGELRGKRIGELRGERAGLLKLASRLLPEDELQRLREIDDLEQLHIAIEAILQAGR